MALNTVTIQGKVLTPDGQVPVSGSIVCKLSQAGSALDGAESERLAMRATGTIAATGLVTLALVPNDVITPSGTAYNVKFFVTVAGGYPVNWVETWQLASSPNPIDIGAISRVAAPGVQFLGVPGGPGDVSSSTSVITGGVSARSLAARFGDRPTPFDFGAIGDGSSHALSTRYATLGAAQIVYPHATALTQEIDWAAIQAAINWWPGGGGPVGLPTARYVCGTGVVLNKNTALGGAATSGGTQPPYSGSGGTILDWSGVAGAVTGLLLPASANGVRVEDLTVLMANQQSGGVTGVIGIDAGTNAPNGTFLKNVTVQQGFISLQVAGQTPILLNVQTQSPRYKGLSITGIGGVVIGGLYANALGWSPNSGNIVVENGGADLLISGAYVDEAFSGAGGSSVVVLAASRVVLDAVHVFYDHNGYGVKLGDGTNNPTDCTLRRVKVERFGAGAAPTAGILLNGSGHALYDVKVDVSADGGATAITDSATGTRMVGVVQITSGGTTYIALKDPNMPTASPGAGSKQLWADPADSYRVKFAN